MKLFWGSTSPYVRKVVVAAEECGLTGRIERVEVFLRIPMKTATDSDGKRPPVPIQSGHFSRGSNLAS